MKITDRIKFALGFMFLPASVLKQVIANLVNDPEVQAMAAKHKGN